MVCDMLEKFNEILLSQLSSEAIDGNFTAPETGTAAKRKRLDKQTRGNGHSDNLM
jgi:hypothetical protein